MAEVMIKLHRMRSPALVFGLVVPLAAFGQSPGEAYVLIGAGLRARPAYDGSDSQRGELIPVLRYYGRPWFARTTQGVLEGGARIELAPGLNLGAQLAYEGGRAASESGFLRSHDVPDIDPGISLGLHAEWDRKLGPVPITLLARVRRHAHADLGAQADLRVTAGIYGEGAILAGVFVQATWANAKSAQSFYGMRYPLLAGIAFLAWYGKRAVQPRNRKLQDATPRAGQIRREIAYSVMAVLIFGVINGVIFGYGIAPHTQLYWNAAQYGWVYFWLSIPLMIVVHDAYFYRTHRLMHTPALLRTFHVVHHRSTHPT